MEIGGGGGREQAEGEGREKARRKGGAGARKPGEGRRGRRVCGEELLGRRELQEAKAGSAREGGRKGLEPTTWRVYWGSVTGAVRHGRGPPSPALCQLPPSSDVFA
jgi:hypothetical protein